MMANLQLYMQQGKRLVRHFAPGTRGRQVLLGLGCTLTGLLLSAASLDASPQPFVLALLCAAPPGWPVILLALGAAAGYPLFWGQAGAQGLAWVMGGLLFCAALGDRPFTRQNRLLMPAAAALVVAAWGTVFRLWLDDQTGLSMYFLRVFLAAGSTRLFDAALRREDSAADWFVGGVAVLALAQLAPLPWLDLGYPAAALLAAGSFPAAALAGLALDLAGIAAAPMTAVLCLGAMLRLLPGLPRWAAALGPAGVYLPVAALCGVWDPAPLPGLLLGGAASLLLPPQVPASRRRSASGIAQVRLELAAQVLDESRALLNQLPPQQPDRQAMVVAAVRRACESCPCRKGCRDRERAEEMPGDVLEKPLFSWKDLEFACRKTGRIWSEIGRGQQQLRTVLGQQRRMEECRQAVVQQYGFLADYLRDLTDTLAAPVPSAHLHFEPEVAVSGMGKESVNGDVCQWFAGTGGRYYVLLCDGMGTGPAAQRDGLSVQALLQRMLRAGFPAQYALESLNSFFILQQRSGAATVDLAELELHTGRAALYKWGAAPSYLLRQGQAEKIGTAGPPPGLSMEDRPTSIERLSLRRGETLVLLSDGAGGEETLRRAGERRSGSLGELADRILACGRGDGSDDATAAVIRLRPTTLKTG